MIKVSVTLYGKPCWEIKMEGEQMMDSDVLRDHGDYLHQHLYDVADIVDRFAHAEWEMEGTAYSLDFWKKNISLANAKKELKKLGINQKLVKIEEWEDIEEMDVMGLDEEELEEFEEV
ncbi:MAG: hypothetical protein WC595_04050 [Candidatus Nanoarchaeia archaeon]